MADQQYEPGTARHPFVGRDRELEAINDEIRRAKNGSGGLVFVSGPLGIGKTRLLDESARLAVENGLRVSIARCWQVGDAPPYWPWIQIVRDLVSGSDMSPPMERDLSQLVEDGEFGRGGSHDIGGAVESPRFALFDSVAALITRVAQKQPLLIALDDVDAADDASATLLEFVRRACQSRPLLLLVTCDDAALDRKLPAPLALTAREGKRLDLGPMSYEAVVELCQKSGGGGLPKETASAVFRMTEGNPFFVHEAVGMLTARQDLHRPDFSSGFRVPKGIRDVVRTSLSALPDEVRALLGIASVIGREFDVTLLAAVADVALDDLLDLLGEATARELISEASALGMYSFSHVLIRETLYEDLKPGVRMRLHRKIGETIEQSNRRNADRRLPELAHHWFKAAQAGDANKSLRYTLRAADQAARQRAPEEAIRMYRRALKVADAAGVPQQEIAEIGRRLEDLKERSDDEVVLPTDVYHARGNLLVREGDYWTIVFEGKTSRLKDMKGVRHLAHLLQNPWKDVHVLELAGDPGDPDARPAPPASASVQTASARHAFGHAGEVLDPTAKNQYRRRLRDLDEEIDEARSFNDQERAARAEAERDALIRELSAAVGLGGRDRVAASASERARVNVTKTIKDALKKIEEHDGALARHLRATVRTGTYCRYDPDPRHPPRWNAAADPTIVRAVPTQ